MSGVKITPISTPKVIGEGPHWLEKSQSLIYLDIPTGNLYRYFPSTKRTQTLHLEDAGTGGSLGFVVPVEGREDEFVFGLGRTLASAKWSPEEGDNIVKKARVLKSIDLNETTTRFNDGKCDPAGRLWAGTMTIDSDPDLVDRKGTLYRFDSEKKSEVGLPKITISNGLGWNQDKTKMYYIDSAELRVDVLDYNNTTGNISNRRSLYDFKSTGTTGLPDGMTTDINGNLWVACFSGSQVLCIDPTVGKLIRKIEFPSKQTTSVCWGGPDYSTLFVTSGTVLVPEETVAKNPNYGKTFAVTGTGSKGVPPDSFKVTDQYWAK